MGSQTGDSEEQSVTFEEVEARMRPGNFSQAGFLGPGESLREVLENDSRELRDLGLSADTLAEQLGTLLEAALEAAKTNTSAGFYKVRIERYKGPQICPFAPQPHENPCPGKGDRRLASIDWMIRNPRSGMQLSGPGLIVHLIASHNFFEGPQSPYRVPPRKLAELLELGPFSRRR
jgi:hypothetical protein